MKENQQIECGSEVWTLIDNDIYHHSGQNVLYSGGPSKENVISECDQDHGIKSEHCLFMTKGSMTKAIYLSCNLISLFPKWVFLMGYYNCVTHWRKQRCLDSYQQRQLVCKVTSNFVEIRNVMYGNNFFSFMKISCIMKNNTQPTWTMNANIKWVT